jgi:F-type H+-transporting ATPase subunit b
MPQLDVATFAPQLFWLAVSFVVLYLLMAKLGLPQVSAAINARRARIDDDLARAAQLKSAAGAVIAAYEQSLAAARAHAQAEMNETSNRLAAEAAERLRQLSQSLAQQTKAAEREIAAAKERALVEMHGIAIEVARSVTEKLTGSAADQGSLAAAVERAMAERAG